MISTDVEAGMGKLVNALKLRLELGGKKQAVVKRQFGLLMRTLINLSFPHDRKKSAERIDDSVLKRFHEINEAQASKLYGEASKAGHGDVIWTGASEFSLYGIAKDVDFREASVGQLESLYYGRGGSRGNRIGGRAKFARGHGKQDIYVWQKITTKAATVKALSSKFASHLGRLKAAWLPAWEASGSPGRSVPTWITKHQGGARGRVIDDLASENPGMTAINRAKGVSSVTGLNQLSAAERIRAQAVVRDVQFAIQHPDKWNERESAIDHELTISEQ